MTSPSPAPLFQPSGYPRRRVSMACQTCRFRKTKCDAKRPSCSFCTNLNIECNYRKVTPEPRHRASRSPHERKGSAPTLTTPEDDTPTSVKSLQSNYSSFQRLSESIKSWKSSTDSHGTTGTPGNLQDRHSYESSPRDYPVPPSYHFPHIHEIHLPELKNVRCLSPMNEIVYDDMEEYLERETIQGDEFFAYVPTKEADLSPRTCWLLQQSFATNILPWLPLFQPDHGVQHLEAAAFSNFDPYNPSSTLTLFVLAVGALIAHPSDTENAVECLHGMEYFHRAYQGIELHGRRNAHNIVTIQCNIISSIYFCLGLRPLQAWYAISEASNAVMVLLRMKKMLERDPVVLENVRRAYWCCYMIEAELLNLVGFATKGLPDLHEQVPPPSRDPSEPGSFYFLSELSMRRLFADLLMTIGYQSGKNNHLPVVAIEHLDQLQTWYDNLAPGLKFPLGPGPVLDPHKAFLKGQYHCILVIANWSFVVRLISDEPMNQTQREHITRHGRNCMEAMYLYVHAVERMMMFRQMMLFANLYGLYCLMIALLATYKVDRLHDIQIDGVEIAIIRGYNALRIWEKNPSTGVCVQRISAMMNRLGIPLQERSPFASYS